MSFHNLSYHCHLKYSHHFLLLVLEITGSNFFLWLEEYISFMYTMAEFCFLKLQSNT